MKPKNTGVGRLSLLQWSFLTQELNWGLSPALQVDFSPTGYEGSPNIIEHLLFAEAVLGPEKKNRPLPQEHTVCRRDRQAVW